MDDKDEIKDQTVHDDKHSLVEEESEEQGEDEPSRDVMDVDQAREKAGMRSDNEGVREVTDAQDLNADARLGEE